MNIDIILAIICFFIGAGIFILTMVGNINQSFIGLTLILVSIIYLGVRSRLKENCIQTFELSFRQKNILGIIFFVIIIITSVMWNDQLYSRPLMYFILISLLSGLISIEIIFFSKNSNAWPVLFKIFFLALVIRLGIYYNFPSIMGYDAYIHTNIANMISTTGYVPPFEISYQYVNYPILHIFISITNVLSYIPMKDAIFFSIGLVSIICSVFIFIFINRLAGPRIGLLSVLMICLTTQIIVTGITNITAGSLVLCYFCVLLWLFMHRERHINALILSLFIIFVIIITHQLTVFVVLLIFCFFAFSLFLFEHVFGTHGQNFKVQLFLAIFGISMILYWIYTPLYDNESVFKVTFGPFVDVLLNGGQYASDTLIVGHVYVRPFIETVTLQTSYLILPFFAIGGIFFWLSRKDGIKFAIACTAAALFFLVYVFPFLGIRNLLTDRWMPFLIIILGFLAAAYIIALMDLIHSNKIKLVTLFSIIVIFSFLMVTIPAINKDNPFVAKDKTIRNQYTNNEISAIERIKSLYGGTIIVDPEFISPMVLYGSNYTLAGHNFYSVVTFASENELLAISENSGLLIVLRKSTLNEPVTLTAPELFGDIIAAPLSKTSFDYLENRENQNLIFTNGNVISYYTNR